MEITFAGKRALVTGATHGIGRAIAIQLAKCGAEVIAVGRTAAHLKTLTDDLPSAFTAAVDLADWDATKDALKNIGPVDLLVNSAGCAVIKPLLSLTEEDINKMFDVNTKAIINVTQIVIGNLLERKVPGAIVNISSQASMAGLVNHAGYCASKGAVDAFTRSVAMDFGPHNIRINCVNPTVIMTDMGRENWSEPAVANPMLAKIPLKRFGEVHEVVDAVLFLLSDKASLITGTCLPVDGGYTAV